MRRLSGLLAIALPAAVLLAAGGCAPDTIEPTGTITSENREIGQVNAVELRCPGVVTIVPNSGPGLTIRADDAAMRYLKTTETDGSLVISVENGGEPIEIARDVTIEVEVRSPTFILLTNRDRGTIRAGELSSDQLGIGNSGAGLVEIERVNAVQITCEVAGSGHVSVKAGRVGAQDIRVTGAGSYLAPNLECGVATIAISGSGDAEVWAKEGLDASIKGTGYVRYWGEPRLTEQAQNSGKTESLGPKPPQ